MVPESEAIGHTDEEDVTRIAEILEGDFAAVDNDERVAKGAVKVGVVEVGDPAVGVCTVVVVVS